MEAKGGISYAEAENPDLSISAKGGDRMALTDQPLPKLAQAGLDRLLLTPVFDNYLFAAEQFVETEQVFRKSERFSAAGFAEAFSENEVRVANSLNDAGLASLDAALDAVRSARNDLDPGLVEEVNRTSTSDDFGQNLTRARESFVDQLLGLDFLKEDFQQIVGLWDRHSQTVSSAGLSGLLDELEATTTQLREVRTQPDRGTAPGSIPWWKALVVAGIILVSLGAVIACFIWFACSWVVQYLAFVSPITLELIRQGC
jgi:hypothetical protein